MVSLYQFAETTHVQKRSGSSTLDYLLKDHLGNQVITTENSGTKTGE
jgi:hypothetical protein